MSAIIIPGAVLWPFGLEWIGLKLMEPAITWMLTVADKIAYLPELLSHISNPMALVPPLLTLGCLWIVLKQGRARLSVLLPCWLNRHLERRPTPRCDRQRNQKSRWCNDGTGAPPVKIPWGKLCRRSWLENYETR